MKLKNNAWGCVCQFCNREVKEQENKYYIIMEKYSAQAPYGEYTQEINGSMCKECYTSVLKTLNERYHCSKNINKRS